VRGYSWQLLSEDWPNGFCKTMFRNCSTQTFPAYFPEVLFIHRAGKQPPAIYPTLYGDWSKRPATYTNNAGQCWKIWKSSLMCWKGE